MLKKLVITIELQLFIILSFQNILLAQDKLVEKQLALGIQHLSEAYNVWKAEPFQEATIIFQEAVRLASDRYLSHYWLGVAYYYQASFFLHARDKDKNDKAGKQAISLGIKALKMAIELNSKDSESYALLGVLQGMMIKMNLWSAPSNGPQVEKNRNQALALNPNNPRVHYLIGISLYMTPELFGGSSDKAIDHMLKAIVLFEDEAKSKVDPLLPQWGYHTCLAFIGDIYYKQKKNKQAYQYYQKALLINPKDLKAIEGLERINQMWE